MKSAVPWLLIASCFLASCRPTPQLSERGSIQHDKAQLAVCLVDRFDGHSLPEEPYGPEIVWYLSITYNARQGDQRTDRQILTESIDMVRREKQEELCRILRYTGGTVDQCAADVFRDSDRADPKIGEYSAGIIFPLSLLQDGKISSTSIVDGRVIFPRPIVVDKGGHSWVPQMVREHYAGHFIAEKTLDK